MKKCMRKDRVVEVTSDSHTATSGRNNTDSVFGIKDNVLYISADEFSRGRSDYAEISFENENGNNSFDAESSTDALQKPNIQSQTGADADFDLRLPTFEEEVEATLAHLDSVSEMHDPGENDKYQDFPVYAVVNKRKINCV